MLYRRGDMWWWEFRFAGRVFREPAKTANREVARRAEIKRRRELKEGYHGLKKRQAPQMLKTAADEWLKLNQPTLAPRSHLIERTNLTHVLPVLGSKLPTDSAAADISRYQNTGRNKVPRPRRSIWRSARSARSYDVTGCGRTSSPTSACSPRPTTSARH
jgi:hypothetical protein